MVLKNILKTKTVSVWGLGYLGYTTILKLQNKGFNILAYDLNAYQMNLFLTGNYPNKEQIASWSHMRYIPQLNLDKIKVAKAPKELFKCSYLHIITIPEDFRMKQNVASKLAKIFSQHLKKSDISPLVIFESAFIPGHIKRYFVKPLKERRLNCSKNYFLGAWFRTDWSIETFISQKDKMPIVGYCANSLRAMKDLFGYLGIPTVELGSLDEAEIYINSINSIQSMVNDFVRQLALGYPSVNIQGLSQVLFKNITLDNCDLNLGTGGTRMTLAIDNLIQGSQNPGSLTLLKEFQDISVSSILNCAEYITRHSYKSVAILGLTYKGNQKDLTLSPSITLANALIKNSVEVLLNDSFVSKDEIHKLVKGAKLVEFPDGVFSTDVLVVACDHNEYKHLSQKMLDKIQRKTKLIIDNYGIWSHLSFGDRIRYYRPGDGSLDLLK